MGILQKLVFILSKLDPDNAQWKQRQIDKVKNTIKEAEEIDDSTIRDRTIAELDAEIENIEKAFTENQLDYGRKTISHRELHLRRRYPADCCSNCQTPLLYITRNRSEDRRGTKENRGVRPLPNLETKFVAADALIGINKPERMTILGPEIERKEEELRQVRKKHFSARTPKTKEKYRKVDKKNSR